MDYELNNDKNIRRGGIPVLCLIGALLYSYFVPIFFHPARTCETFIITALITSPLWLTAAYLIQRLVPVWMPQMFYCTYLAMALICVMSVYILNGLLDDSPTKRYVVSVKDVHRDWLGRRGARYYTVVPAFVPSKFSFIGFEDGLFLDNYEHIIFSWEEYSYYDLKGVSMMIFVKQGYFGIPWVSYTKFLL